MNSPLARYAHLMREPDETHARAAARTAWVEGGLVLINPSWLGWADRQQVTLIADRLHGKRKSTAGDRA